MTTINPEKLALLDTLEIHEGNHRDFEQGHCSMEVVSWLADQGFTDAPPCASPVLGRYVICLNDRWDHERRQTLKPYLPRLVGTGDDGKDARREEIASEWLTGRLLGPWLELAGMGDHLSSIEGKAGRNLADALRQIRRAARAKQDASRAELRSKIQAAVRERLATEKKPDADAVTAAVTVAAAVADAVTVAAAAAVADAAADAVTAAITAAVAAAISVAAADAVTAAVAVTAADAVAVTAAITVAVAVAVADAAAAADAAPFDTWGTSYSPAHKAVTAYYREHPLPVMDVITDLAAKQEPLALELLDALIVAAPAEVAASASRKAGR